MPKIAKSDKLSDVLYDIRGPVLSAAHKLEEQGVDIQKLNIGNPAPFGFHTSKNIRNAIAANLQNSQGYCESKGIPSAREAIQSHYQARNVRVDSIENIYIGNGASELIVMAMQALLNNNDEVLLPAPDYPLWTAAVRLSGGIPVHYRCDEQSGWHPDLKDITRKISSKTKALVIINPNNPTGSLYSSDILEAIVKVAVSHNILLFSDEIYDQVIYDNHSFYSTAQICSDAPVILFNGLSKNYCACGYRAGWMVLCNTTQSIRGYQEGLDMLSNMRLCSNVPSQYAIEPALRQSSEMNILVSAKGRLYGQRKIALDFINDTEGLSCTSPRATFYLFPKIDSARFNITSDTQFAYDLLHAAHILIVQGSGFNCPDQEHFRIVFLPPPDELQPTLNKLAQFLAEYRQVS